MQLVPQRYILAMTLAGVTLLCSQQSCMGQFFRSNAVGGVAIDAEGVLANPELGDLNELAAAWKTGQEQAPTDMAKPSPLRFVSLRRIEAILAEKAAAGLPVPDEVLLMAGLQRVQYVLVYPDQRDIVLAGPAEGWKPDRLGNFVGITTGRPVIALDDFMVALRAANDNPGAGMSCSIDPTAEGLARVQQVTRTLTANTGPQRAAEMIAGALGLQKITVTGVSDTSHFARTMVAADFRMKRLAMGFEPAPCEGLPSYLEILGKRPGKVTRNMTPRWWLAPDYNPVLRDQAGMAWELRGQGVKCLTEEDYFNASGEKTRTVKAGPAAQKWADLFTEHFEQLQDKDSTFGELRNAIDLAVATTLIVHQGLAEQVGLSMPQMLGQFEVGQFNAPKQVATQTTFVRAGGQWLVTASGGILVAPGEVLADSEEVDQIAAVADQEVRLASEKSWWWDAK